MSPKKTKYDLIFSIGGNCSCTEAIRLAGLQYLSFPLDWAGPTEDHPEIFRPERDVLDLCDAVCRGFRDCYNEEDFLFIAERPQDDTASYVNRRTGWLFNHDFKVATPLAECYPAVIAKYRRRIARFLSLVRASKRVLAVRIDRPTQPVPTTVADCRTVLDRLSAGFPGVRFDLVLFNHEAGRPPAELTEERPDERLTRFAFDLRDRSQTEYDFVADKRTIAPMLAARYSVRDYRTREERRAEKRRRLAKKYAALGAKNALDYRLKRYRQQLRRFFGKFRRS